jgi:hypothetical protein
LLHFFFFLFSCFFFHCSSFFVLVSFNLFLFLQNNNLDYFKNWKKESKYHSNFKTFCKNQIHEIQKHCRSIPKGQFSFIMNWDSIVIISETFNLKWLNDLLAGGRNYDPMSQLSTKLDRIWSCHRQSCIK